MTLLQRTIEDAVTTIRGLKDFEEPLNRAARMVLTGLTGGHKLLVCGNGGSASDATHLATEFLCRFQQDRRPYPAISLTANGEFMTAVCNDYHADEIFARQVWGLGKPGDVLEHPRVIASYLGTDDAVPARGPQGGFVHLHSPPNHP